MERKKTQGYAEKNVGKWTRGHCATDLGVLPFTVYTHPGDAEQDFTVRALAGNSVWFSCKGGELSSTIKGYIAQRIREAQEGSPKAQRFVDTAKRLEGRGQR